MIQRFLAYVVSVAVVALASSTVVVNGQAPPAGEGWTAARTPDGQPDLQGIWTNATLTPFERPAALKGKPFLTEAEAAALEKRAAEGRIASDRVTPGEVGSYNQFWFDSGTTVLSTRQTSLVVDPPDGRVPVTPAAEAVRDYNLAHYGDSYEHMSVWDRCITRGVPGSIFPAGYNNAYQIVQTPGYVVILYEMIHDARIIPVDGRPPLPQPMRLWMGDSRGRWEGDTLVIETTNFNKKGMISSSAAGGRIKGIPHTEQLRVVERLKRTAQDTINYSVTIEDPEIYTKAWTVAFPLTMDPEYRIYEYACHEGNYAMENMLRGARALESAAGAKKP